MNRSRLVKLERHRREQPCPECGRASRPSAAAAPASALDRLTASERAEYARLVRITATPLCRRCGRAGFDIGRLTDDQKCRSLWLGGRRHGCGWEGVLPSVRGVLEAGSRAGRATADAATAPARNAE